MNMSASGLILDLHNVDGRWTCCWQASSPICPPSPPGSSTPWPRTQQNLINLKPLKFSPKKQKQQNLRQALQPTRMELTTPRVSQPPSAAPKLQSTFVVSDKILDIWYNFLLFILNRTGTLSYQLLIMLYKCGK